MKKCPYCGKEYQSDYPLFCSGCGANMGTPVPERETKTSSKEKKLWTTIILLIVALSLAVAAIFIVPNVINNDDSVGVSSSDDKEDKKKKKSSAEAEETEEEEDPEANLAAAETTVGDFMTAYVSYDIEGIEDLVYDTRYIPASMKVNPVDTVLEEALATESGAIFIGHEEEAREAIQALCDNLIASTSYEITDSYEEDGYYVFEVTVTTPDADGVNFEDYVSENDLYGVIMGLYLNGELTEGMSEDEMMAVIIPACCEYLRDVFAEVDLTQDTIKLPGTIVVKEYDDEWLVCAKDSDFSTLEKYYD